MLSREVLTTVSSESCRYEVVRIDWGILGVPNYRFFVFRDGQEIDGPFCDYHRAVAVARTSSAL